MSLTYLYGKYKEVLPTLDGKGCTVHSLVVQHWLAGLPNKSIIYLTGESLK